jgi:hypothetical protein
MQPSKTGGVVFAAARYEEMQMKRTALILATLAALGTAAVSSPAEARYGHRGWGPGIGFGLAAGALAAGAIAATQPHYYNGYYGPRYRRVYYEPAPYAYYGPRYYAPRYYGW